jgi:acetyl-CoA carboxylase carboxyltransferase component
MNPDLLTRALGVPEAVSPTALPLVVIDGRPATVATSWSGDALEVAARRGTALVIVMGGEAPSNPVIAAARPWPIVAVAESPWGVRAADLGLLVGAHGPADHDGLDEEGAAVLTRRFLRMCADGESSQPGGHRSLLDIVPFPIEEPYEPEPVLERIVDDGNWLELDADSAREVLTIVARIGGRSVGIAASRPGFDQGRLGPAGCARVARLLRWCSRGGRPFLSMVDTAGVGEAEDIEELETMRNVATSVRGADVVKLAIVTGRAMGLGATVLAAVGGRADMVMPWPRAHFALTDSPARIGGDGEAESSAVGRAARSGDVMDVMHPDETRARVIEALELLRGRPKYRS